MFGCAKARDRWQSILVIRLANAGRGVVTRRQRPCMQRGYPGSLRLDWHPDCRQLRLEPRSQNIVIDMPLLLAGEPKPSKGTRLAVHAARVVFPAADREEIAAAVVDILTTGRLTLGPYTGQFEAAFAAAHCSGEQPAPQPPHAVAVSSGSAALEIILRTIGVAGSDVVIPANTFFATAEAALRAGGRPVFADMDPLTFALSPQTLLPGLTPRPSPRLALP